MFFYSESSTSFCEEWSFRLLFHTGCFFLAPAVSVYKLFICKECIQLLLFCSNDIVDSRIIQCLQELWKQFFRISGAAAKCAVVLADYVVQG